MNDIDEKRLTYPRVSEIISKQNYNELRTIPLDTLLRASIRGTAVHKYCTIFLKKLFMPEIEAEYQIYVDAFIGWAEQNVVEVINTSQRLYDDELRFSGEFDAIVVLKDKSTCLIDIKTSAAQSKSWDLQVAAYNHLCKKYGYQITKVMNVHLKKKISIKTEEIQGQKVKVSSPVVSAKEIIYDAGNLTSAWSIFTSALACYDYFDRKEELECLPTNCP
jgi:hypothetical protein